MKKSSKPSTPAMTVAERRRQLRDAKAPAGPGVKKVEIDLSKPGARKALLGLYPCPTSDTIIDSTPDTEAAALEYIVQRDAAKIATEKKEAAGNVLCNAIAKNTGIRGEGWTAAWDMSKGSVDWSALAKDLGISDEVIAKYRKPSSRGLDVTEVAEEA